MDNEKSMDDMVLGFTHKVAETQDAFIFQTLSNFATQNYQMTVDKQELAESIQLIRALKEEGWLSLHDMYLRAMDTHRIYQEGYNAGFKAGRESICKQIREEFSILKEDEEND